MLKRDGTTVKLIMNFSLWGSFCGWYVLGKQGHKAIKKTFPLWKGFTLFDAVGEGIEPSRGS